MSEQTAMMTFPDGSEGPVPGSAVAQAIAKGAKLKSRKPSAPPSLPHAYSEIPTGEAASFGLTNILPNMLPMWPARIAAAGIASGANHLIGNMMNHQPAMQGVGQSAVMGAGGQTVGEAGGGVLNLVGRGLLHAAIPVAGETGEKAVEEMAAKKMLAGKLGKGRSVRNWQAATGARDAANAAASGAVPAGPLDQEFATMEQGALGRSDRTAQLSALHKRYGDFLKSWSSGSMSPTDAQTYLSSLDEEANQLWSAAKDKSTHIPHADQVAAQQAKQLSGVLRKQMQQIVTNHKALSADLSRAIAAKTAIGKSALKPSLMRVGARSTAGAALGGAIGGATGDQSWQGRGKDAALGALLANSPEALSALGILGTSAAPAARFILPSLNPLRPQ